MSTIEAGTRRDPETLTLEEVRAVIIGGQTLLSHPDTAFDERLYAKSRDLTDWYRQQGRNHGDQVVASMPVYYCDLSLSSLIALASLEEFPTPTSGYLEYAHINSPGVPANRTDCQSSLIRFMLGRSPVYRNIAELSMGDGALQADIHSNEAMDDRTPVVPKEKLTQLLNPIIELGRSSLVHSIAEFE